MQYNYKDSREYLWSFILTNGKQDKNLLAIGYLTANGAEASFHYYVPDHLGNNRVVVKQDGTVEQVNHYYPYGGLMGESTGGDIQKYKYNGKRLERNHVNK